MLQLVEDALEHKRVFRRARKSNRLRALGIVLYHLGLSLRDCSTVLFNFGEASHEAIRKWYLKCRHLFHPTSRKRRAIAVDETKIKIQGKWMYVWAAIDIDTWDVLATWARPGKVGIGGSILHTGGSEGVREQSHRICRQSPLVPLGIEPSWGTMGAQDVRSQESDRTMVRDTEAEDKEVLQEMAAQCKH